MENYGELWNSMQNNPWYRCYTKIVNVQCYEGDESEWFKVKTGVKQGDVMSGFIFLIVVDWIMRNTTA